MDSSDDTDWMPKYKPFDQVFWGICTEEFPAHIDQLRKAAGDVQLDENSLSDPRFMKRFCRELLMQVQAPWPRYERFLAHHNLLHLLTPLLKGESCPEVFEQFEPGSLLSHRAAMSFYSQRKIVLLIDNADHRPYWALDRDDACPGCLDDSNEPVHWQSTYWQHKQVPCEWLRCRSGIRAFTERDMIRRGYR